MRMSQENFGKVCRILVTKRLPIVCLILALCSVSFAQQGTNGSAKTDVTGHYEGYQTSRVRAPAPHNLASKKCSTRARTSGAIFDS